MSLKFNDACHSMKHSSSQPDFEGLKVSPDQGGQSSAAASGRRSGKKLIEAYQERFIQPNLSDLKETDETSERLTIKNSGALASAARLDPGNKSFLCVIDTHLKSLARNQRESSRRSSKKLLSPSKDKEQLKRGQLFAPNPATDKAKRAPVPRRASKPDLQTQNHNTSSSSLIGELASAQAEPQNSSLVHTIEYQAKEILRLNDELNSYKSKYLAAKHTAKQLQQALAEVDSVFKASQSQACLPEDPCCPCRLSHRQSFRPQPDSCRKVEPLELFASSLAVKKLIGASQPLDRRKSTLLSLFKKSSPAQPDLNRRASATSSNSKTPQTTANMGQPADPFANITKRRLTNSSLLISPPFMNTTQASHLDCHNLTSQHSKHQTSLQQSAINHVRSLRKKSRNELINKLCSKDKLFH